MTMTMMIISREVDDGTMVRTMTDDGADAMIAGGWRGR